jgi:chromosome segregation ATPase
MSEYPRMMYRNGGDCQGCETLVVADEGDEIANAAKGWFRTVDEAKASGAEPAKQDDSTKALTADLQAAAELLEEERQAHQSTQAELQEANDTIADLRAQIEAATAPASKGKAGG